MFRIEINRRYYWSFPAYTHGVDSIPWTFSQIEEWPPFYINAQVMFDESIRAYARLQLHLT